jgi:PhnB protein
VSDLPTVAAQLSVPHAVVERSIGLGATQAAAVEEGHGWLLGRIQDPFGHHWEIGKPLGTWPPSSL